MAAQAFDDCLTTAVAGSKAHLTDAVSAKLVPAFIDGHLHRVVEADLALAVVQRACH